jgi:hypothetical protein
MSIQAFGAIAGFVTKVNDFPVSFGKMSTLGKNQSPETAARRGGQRGPERGPSVMIKTAYAIAVSAIAGFLFVAFPSLSPQVGASAPIVGAKGDRADIRPLGVECGQKAWPYYDAACMRDARMPLLIQPHDVRIVAAVQTAK